MEGVVEMMLDATGRYDQPLTAERLFAWHASLFPTERSGMIKIKAGAWRDNRAGPMQIVSGPARERSTCILRRHGQIVFEPKCGDFSTGSRKILASMRC